MATIVGVGEILWDMLPGGKQLGGAPANFAYHTKVLGQNKIDAYIFSAIGNDALGKEIQSCLTDLEINQQYLHINDLLKTGSVLVSLNKQGIPDYTIKQDVAWDFIPKIPNGFHQTIDVVSFGTLAQRSPISRSNITHFLSDLPATTLKIFDINLRQSFYNQEIIESSLILANIFKLNEDELSLISDMLHIFGNQQQQLRTLSERYNCKLGILTKGHLGSILYTKNKTSIHPGFKIDSSDTVGAGDAFTAAIAMGQLKGLELDTMNDYANQVASYVCSKAGATAKLPQSLINLFC